MARVHGESAAGRRRLDHGAPPPVRILPLAALLFFQVLPATLVVAAIRPLFVSIHGGDVSAMHAFMSLNMIGAILVASPIAALADRMRSARPLLVALTVADAILLVACASPVPTVLALTLRFFEGAAHVGATTLLLAEASAIARTRGEGKIMGIAGAAIVFAIAAGNALGGTLVSISPFTPFLAGAATALFVAIAAAIRRDPEERVVAHHEKIAIRPLILPLTAAFVERFAVGCFVVSFALFAHARHGVTDSAIGWLYFAMTFTFAIAMAPAGRLADRMHTPPLLAAGAVTYGLALLTLAVVNRTLLPLSMIVAGAGAALMFAPALSAAAAASHNRRAAAMALMNAAGCLGMTTGPIVSGIAIAVARRSGEDQGAIYSRPLFIAGFALIAWSAAALFSKSRIAV
jgi:MFS family permease